MLLQTTVKGNMTVIFRKTIKDITTNKELYLILLPVIINFIVFHYAPMWGVQIAFRRYNLVTGTAGSPWIGLENFIDFFNSIYVWELIRNTIVLSLITLVFGFPNPIILAILLNEVRNEKFKKFVQTVSYLPYFISIVVVVGMLKTFLAPDDGIVNLIVEKLGGESIYFLGEPAYFRPIYLIMQIWRYTGFDAIIYIAAIVGIDQELYEAAHVDGAGRLRRIWHITIPGIKSTIIILFILRIGSILNVGWQEILLLSNSLNGEVSEVIQTFVYKRGLIDADYSFATAIGLFQSVIGFVLIIVSNKISKKVSDSYIF